MACISFALRYDGCFLMVSFPSFVSVDKDHVQEKTIDRSSFQFTHVRHPDVEKEDVDAVISNKLRRIVMDNFPGSEAGVEKAKMFLMIAKDCVSWRHRAKTCVYNMQFGGIDM